MSSENSNPEVVVLGMPSCGKTVFLSVLGKKFTDVVDGRRAAPLGFRLSTCDVETAEVVNSAYDRLREGKWPSATNIGQTMPLRWELFTGRRRIFELFSMDIAGETFKEAFGIKDGASAQKRQEQAPKKVDSDDDDLFRGNEEGASSSSDTGDRQEIGDAAQRLKNAVNSAKIVCFLINVSLPENIGRAGMSSFDATRLARFRSAVVNMYLLLKKNRGLRSRSVIVLTQAHSHQAEIDRAGGPGMFLGDLCGGEAVELCNLAKDSNIPVIAVSAVNEREGDDSIPEIKSPSDIPSDGLFGFLLLVAGMAGGDKDLSSLKDSYVSYQRARVNYLQSPCRDVASRFELAKEYKAAADVFVDGCCKYLDDSANFTGVGGGTASTLALYRRCTLDDPEVKAARECEYLTRDAIWDGVLRQAAIIERRSGSAIKTRDVYVNVKDAMAEALPGRTASEEFIFGFDEDELASGGIASTNDAWIRHCMDIYAQMLDDGLNALSGICEKIDLRLKHLKASIGTDEFIQRRNKAFAECKKFLDAYKAFMERWQCGGDSCPDEALDMKERCNCAYDAISKAQADHDLAVKAKVENERRRRAARTRNVIIFMATFFIVAVAGVLSFFKYSLEKRNCEISQRIEGALSSSDYGLAEHLYGTIKEVRWLLVHRERYLCDGFESRLAGAKSLGSQLAEVSSKKEELQGLRNAIASSGDEDADALKEVLSVCDGAMQKCNDLDMHSPAEDVLKCEIELAPRMEAAEACHSELGDAIKIARDFKNTTDARLARLAFNSGLAESKSVFEKCAERAEAILANETLDVKAASKALEESMAAAGMIGKLVPVDGDDADRKEELLLKAETLCVKLDASIAKQVEAERMDSFKKSFAALESAESEVRGCIDKLAEGAQGIDVDALSAKISELSPLLAKAVSEAGNDEKDKEKVRAYDGVVERLQADLKETVARRRASVFGGQVSEIGRLLSAYDLDGANKALDAALSSSESDSEREQINSLRRTFEDNANAICESRISDISVSVKSLSERASAYNLDVKWLADRCLDVSKEIDDLKAFADKWLGASSGGAGNLAERIASLRSALPIVVIINGVSAKGERIDVQPGQPSRQLKVVGGIYEGTHKRCVYVIVPDAMLSSIQSWVVQVNSPAARGSKRVLIQRANLIHGVNVIEAVFN